MTQEPPDGFTYRERERFMVQQRSSQYRHSGRPAPTGPQRFVGTGA
jgi:hypothetical protein